MGILGDALKESGIEIPSVQQIEKGSVFLIKDKLMEKFVKNSVGNTPPFLMEKYKTTEKAKFDHRWIFLKKYDKKFKRSSKIPIVIRSADQKKRKFHDYEQKPHHDLIENHDKSCIVDKKGFYKSDLPVEQKLDKTFLDEIDMYTDNNDVRFSCIDPEVEKVIRHFKRINEVYD
tara:strand:- start:14047 stop:14568 length:522 start_codon:yes stop_codon:yes gene_type:complete